MKFTKDLIGRYGRPFLTIDCGDYTYGDPHLRLADTDKARKVIIGRYCSIGDNVSIFVGRQGNHPTTSLTTYPLRMVTSPEALARNNCADLNDRTSAEIDIFNQKLDVEIGNDVWIGSNVIIRAGLSIGTGAVIATNAVVAHDVRPYEIVGGVPAKHIRYRFQRTIADRLLASRWWELSPDEIFDVLGDRSESRVVEDAVAGLEEFRRRQPGIN